jgi:hypothetical protein
MKARQSLTVWLFARKMGGIQAAQQNQHIKK